MDLFYYERPSMRRKADIVDYIHEFSAFRSEINGSGSLDKIQEGYSFEQALERCLRLENEDYAVSVGRCPGKTFLLIRTSDDRLIGTINIRWKLNEPMLRFGGHIGYAIRPTERRRGYSKLNLYMGLQEAQKLGLERVMLGCAAQNIGSDKCIRALGGVLERCELDPEDGLVSNVYWIDVKSSLEEYRGVYEALIAAPGSVNPNGRKMISRIETERLILRKAEPRDLDLIWNRVWRDDRLAAMMLWTPTLTREGAEARLQRTMTYQRDNYGYFVCLKETDEPIGFGGCREIAPGEWDETGLCIAADWQGRGFGKELLRALVDLAFRELGGRLFHAACFHENIASAATIRSCGFSYVSSHPETRERDGYGYLCDCYELRR